MCRGSPAFRTYLCNRWIYGLLMLYMWYTDSLPGHAEIITAHFSSRCLCRFTLALPLPPPLCAGWCNETLSICIPLSLSLSLSLCARLPGTRVRARARACVCVSVDASLCECGVCLCACVRLHMSACLSVWVCLCLSVSIRGIERKREGQREIGCAWHASACAHSVSVFGGL
jgi:hypothetical protein